MSLQHKTGENSVDKKRRLRKVWPNFNPPKRLSAKRNPSSRNTVQPVLVTGTVSLPVGLGLKNTPAKPTSVSFTSEPDAAFAGVVHGVTETQNSYPLSVISSPPVKNVSCTENVQPRENESYIKSTNEYNTEPTAKQRISTPLHRKQNCHKRTCAFCLSQPVYNGGIWTAMKHHQYSAESETDSSVSEVEEGHQRTISAYHDRTLSTKIAYTPQKCSYNDLQKPLLIKPVRENTLFVDSNRAAEVSDKMSGTLSISPMTPMTVSEEAAMEPLARSAPPSTDRCRSPSSRSDRSSSRSPSSRKSSPKSDYYTQMEPLFPQRATLKGGISSEVATVTTMNTTTKETTYRTGAHSNKPEPAYQPKSVIHTSNKVDQKRQSSYDQQQNHLQNRQYQQPHVLEQPQQLQPYIQSQNQKHQQSPSHQQPQHFEPHKQLHDHQGHQEHQPKERTVENIQISSSVNKPLSKISYLPRTYTKHPGAFEFVPKPSTTPFAYQHHKRTPPSHVSADGSLLSSGLPRRTMSHSNVYGTRSWNLRSNQGSESDLTYRRVATVSNTPTRSSYSARRERLRQEQEQELWQRQHPTAASSIGLNESQTFANRNRNQQQYRSMSAVNQTAGGTETFEEIETIILEPIGRGVHDIDSRVGSMTTLPRGPAGSLTEGLHRTDDGIPFQRNNSLQRGYASTQYLTRNNSTLDIGGPRTVRTSTIVPGYNASAGVSVPHYSTSVHQPQPVQTNIFIPPSRYGSQGPFSTAESSNLEAAVPTPQSQPTSPSPWEQPNNGMVTVDGDMVDSGIDYTGIQGTAPSWYRPNLTRAEAISILRDQPPGSFLVRNSSTYTGIFVLAVKLATLPPKVTQKTQDLQSELVRHYLIDVVVHPSKGVRIKGFASEPVFPTLTSLIYQHTINPLALPCKLVLSPSSNAIIPESGLVNGNMAGFTAQNGGMSSDMGSTVVDGVTGRHRSQNNTKGSGLVSNSMLFDGMPIASSTIPFVCVVHDNSAMLRSSACSVGTSDPELGGKAFRCFMLGSIDTPQWDDEICFARSVDKLIPRDQLTAAECDHGVSPVLYTEVQLHVSAHDGITIIDLHKRSFLRRHLPNQVLKYCGLETRGKMFLHPTHQLQGMGHPRIFGIVVRKGISECTTHVFSECSTQNSAETIVRHILSTYPHLSVR